MKIFEIIFIWCQTWVPGYTEFRFNKSLYTGLNKQENDINSSGCEKTVYELI